LKKKKQLFFNLLLALTVFLGIYLFLDSSLFTRLEFLSLDSRFTLRKKTPASPNIIIIEINDQDIAKIGRWPWKRSWHGAITRALTDMGADIIYFDMIFSEPSQENQDLIFEQAIKESKNVYLPFAFSSASLDIDKAFLPLNRLSEHSRGGGSINIYPDQDGIMRRLPLLFFTPDKDYYHIALSIAMDYQDLSLQSITPYYLTLSSKHNYDTVKIPLDQNGSMLINWSGKWGQSFTHYGFSQILNEYTNFLENKKTSLNLNKFKNSICLVAVTGLGLYDIKPIPLQPEYPGIGVTATAISNILSHRFLYFPPFRISLIIYLLMSFIPPFLSRGIKPLQETFYILGLAMVYLGLNFLFFLYGVILPVAIPLICLFLSYFVIEIYIFYKTAKDRQRFFKMAVTDGLTGLYNVSYFKILLKAELMLTRPDPERSFVLIMCDIDFFKLFNDTFGHQVGDLVLKEISQVIKSSVRSSDVVARYGGEEIIILLRGAKKNTGAIVAEKIRKNVEQCLINQSAQISNITISAGYASSQKDDTVESIIKRADQGLYKAKKAGRNCLGCIE